MVKAGIIGVLWFATGAFSQSADAIFDPAHLHDIYLEIKTEDWQDLQDNYLLNTKYEAGFYWNEFRYEKVTIRSRGSKSRNPVKPSLKIDFDGVDKKLRFGSLKSLVLDNNSQDESLIKERLSMGLLGKLGQPVPRLSLGKLFINGKFAGVYTVTEPVDEAFLQRHFGESAGYLYEYNSVQPYFFEELDAADASFLQRFEPKTHEKDPHPEPLLDFIRSINRLPDDRILEYLQARLNVPRLLQYLAAEQYLGDADGLNGWDGINNFYLYQSGTPERFEFIPWDKDLTFTDQPSVVTRFDEVTLTRRIWQNPDLRRMYLGYVQEIAERFGGSGGWLHQELDFLVHQVRETAHADPLLLCPAFDGELVPCTGDEGPFENEIRRMKEFLGYRNDTVLHEMTLLGGPAPSSAPVGPSARD